MTCMTLPKCRSERAFWRSSASEGSSLREHRADRRRRRGASGGRGMGRTFVRGCDVHGAGCTGEDEEERGGVWRAWRGVIDVTGREG